VSTATETDTKTTEGAPPPPAELNPFEKRVLAIEAQANAATEGTEEVATAAADHEERIQKLENSSSQESVSVPFEDLFTGKISASGITKKQVEEIRENLGKHLTGAGPDVQAAVTAAVLNAFAAAEKPLMQTLSEASKASTERMDRMEKEFKEGVAGAAPLLTRAFRGYTSTVQGWTESTFLRGVIYTGTTVITLGVVGELAGWALNIRWCRPTSLFI